jgi:hypothetical protein
MKLIPIIILLLMLPAAYADAQVAVIANRSVPDASLTAREILDLYLLNTNTWSDGQVVELMCLRGNPAEEKRFFELLHRSPLEMRKIWLRARLSGLARAPEMIDSQDELVKRVAATRGAIGFVAREKVQGNVKILYVIE